MPAPSTAAARSHGSIDPCPAFRPVPAVSGSGAKLGGASGAAIGGEEAAGLGTAEVVRSGTPEEEDVGALAGGPAWLTGARCKVRPALPAVGDPAGPDPDAAAGALRALRVTFAGGAVSARGGAVSAGRVTVPPILKFCSSRGPTASGAGVLVVGGGVVWGGL